VFLKSLLAPNMDLEEQANIWGGLQRQRSNQELEKLNQPIMLLKRIKR
jgi:hypothetical protein